MPLFAHRPTDKARFDHLTADRIKALFPFVERNRLHHRRRHGAGLGKLGFDLRYVTPRLLASGEEGFLGSEQLCPQVNDRLAHALYLCRCCRWRE